MAERKVLIKYFPKNFNHEIIVKRGRGKDKLMMVRNMLPMSLRCNTCANYLYIGTKFNMRMEICNEETYLGIKVFRFYFKCTYCYAEITFKTDPKNHDYVVETGGTRNYQAIKDAQQAQKYLRKLKSNQKEENSMKYLENKSYDSKRQMELMEALQDIKNLNKRQAVIDPQDLLKNLIYEEEEEQGFEEEQEAEIQKRYQEMKEKVIAQKIEQLEQRQNDDGEVKVENPDQNIKELIVGQIAVKEEKIENESKHEWKKFLTNGKGGQAKFRLKGGISSMKKKITKPSSHQKQQKQSNQDP